MLGLWLWDEILKKISDLDLSLEKLVLWETPTSYITIDKKDME